MAKRTVKSEDIVASTKQSKAESKKSIKDPSQSELQEAFSPELSEDVFKVADKSFKIRISSIRVQKIMAKSLDSITELVKKIDIIPIFKNLQSKMQRDRQKLVERIKDSGDIKNEAAVSKTLEEMAEDSANDYLDIVELVRDIIQHGGISNILITIMDLFTGIIFAICHAQDDSVTLDWIENNISTYEAQDIFFRQMEKDKIGGRVIDFLHILTRQLFQETE